MHFPGPGGQEPQHLGPAGGRIGLHVVVDRGARPEAQHPGLGDRVLGRAGRLPGGRGDLAEALLRPDINRHEMPARGLLLAHPGRGEVGLGAGPVGAADVDAGRPVRRVLPPGLHLRGARRGARIEAQAGVAGRGGRQRRRGGGPDPGRPQPGHPGRRGAAVAAPRGHPQPGAGQHPADLGPVGAVARGDRDPPGHHGDHPVLRVLHRARHSVPGGRLHQHGLGRPDQPGRAVLDLAGRAEVQHVPVEPDALARMRGQLDDPPATRDGEGGAQVPDRTGGPGACRRGPAGQWYRDQDNQHAQRQYVPAVASCPQSPGSAVRKNGTAHDESPRNAALTPIPGMTQPFLVVT